MVTMPAGDWSKLFADLVPVINLTIFDSVFTIFHPMEDNKQLLQANNNSAMHGAVQYCDGSLAVAYSWVGGSRSKKSAFWILGHNSGSFFHSKFSSLLHANGLGL